MAPFLRHSHGLCHWPWAAQSDSSTALDTALERLTIPPSPVRIPSPLIRR